MVHLERMSSHERLDLCRKYFFIGFACLPFVWLVNCLWFYRYAFCSKADNEEERNGIKKYVVMSLVGFFFWMVLVTAWLGVYTVARTERAEWAEWLIYIVPLGRV